MLYGKNIFSFDKLRDLLWFEEQIGSANCDLVQRIEIVVNLEYKIILQDADVVAPCDWNAAPAYWAKTLMKSRLKDSVEMRISNDLFRHWNGDTSSTTSSLYHAIDDVFRRNNRTMPPRVTLRGVTEEDRHKFPENWQLKFEQRACRTMSNTLRICAGMMKKLWAHLSNSALHLVRVWLLEA